MNVIKIILGVIMGIAWLLTLIETIKNEYGFGLLGGLMGSALTAALIYWLISSGMKGFQDKK